MSLKEFFNQAILKPTVVDFLRNRGEFRTLGAKAKKPFRGQLQRNLDNEVVMSDGYQAINCRFSEKCRAEFEDRYPSSINIDELDGTLVCVNAFCLKLEHKLTSDADELKAADVGETKQHVAQGAFKEKLLSQKCWRSTSVKVYLLVDSLKVITFDNVFQGKGTSSNVADEVQVEQHLRFMAHHLYKERAVEFAASKTLPPINATMLKSYAKNSTKESFRMVDRFANKEHDGLTSDRYEQTIAQIRSKGVENPEVEPLEYCDLRFKDRHDGFDSVHASEYSDLSLELARTYEDTYFESVDMPARHSGMIEPTREDVEDLTGAPVTLEFREQPAPAAPTILPPTQQSIAISAGELQDALNDIPSSQLLLSQQPVVITDQVPPLSQNREAMKFVSRDKVERQDEEEDIEDSQPFDLLQQHTNRKKEAVPEKQASQKVEPAPQAIDLIPLISDEDDDVKMIDKVTASAVGSQTKAKNKTPFRFTSTRAPETVLQNNDSNIENELLEREARQRKEREDKDRIDLQQAIESSQKQRQGSQMGAESNATQKPRDIIGIGMNHQGNQQRLKDFKRARAGTEKEKEQEAAKSDNMSQYDILDTVAVVKDDESQSSQPPEQPVVEQKKDVAEDDSVLLITSGATSAVKAAPEKKTNASKPASSAAASKKKATPITANQSKLSFGVTPSRKREEKAERKEEARDAEVQKAGASPAAAPSSSAKKPQKRQKVSNGKTK